MLAKRLQELLTPNLSLSKHKPQVSLCWHDNSVPKMRIDRLLRLGSTEARLKWKLGVETKLDSGS
jgi:hypothetical protein